MEIYKVKAVASEELQKVVAKELAEREEDEEWELNDKGEVVKKKGKTSEST